jgi:hypothetical protein
MRTGHELHAYDYVNRPYDAVRKALLADPLALFRHATTVVTGDDANAELRVKAGPFDFGTEVDIQVVKTELGESPNGRPATKVEIEWKAAHRPGMFPTMRATLSVYALTATETQLDFAGTYDPPLGVVGDAVDATAMKGVAKQSVDGFVHGIATFLRNTLAAGKPA